MPTVPSVSIIIPAYNAAPFIGEAIESVLQQDYKPIECIVVDDGSIDDTAEEIRRFGRSVRYHYQENHGCSAARNLGLALACGEYVAFLDADDRFEPSKIGEQMRWLEINPDYGAVYTRAVFFDAEGSLYEHVWPTPSGDIADKLLMGNFIASPTPLFRMSAVRQVEGYNVGYRHSEDWDLYLRLALAGVKFGFLDRYLAWYRVHATNVSHNRLAMARAKLEIVESIVNQERQKIEGFGLNPDLVLAHHRADLGKYLCLNGQLTTGRQLIAAALQEAIPQKLVYRLFFMATFMLSTELLASLEQTTYRKRKTASFKVPRP